MKLITLKFITLLFVAAVLIFFLLIINCSRHRHTVIYEDAVEIKAETKGEAETHPVKPLKRDTTPYAP